MKTGFTFKGKHTSEFGVISRTKSRPILPPMKKYTLSAPFADGEYDFSDANIYGRSFYSSRSFTVTITVVESDIFELQKKLSKIAVWLSGKGVLMFDDIPLVQWNARIIDSIDTIPEIIGRKAELEIVFEAEPFAECVFDVTNGPELDCFIPLSENIPIELPLFFEYNFETREGIVPIVNMGTWHARPLITITGTNYLNTLSLSTDEKQLYFHINTPSVVIDFENQTAVNEKGENVLSTAYISDGFFEFEPGITALKVQTRVDVSNLNVKIEYRPKYIYGFECDINWGDAHA